MRDISILGASVRDTFSFICVGNATAVMFTCNGLNITFLFYGLFKIPTLQHYLYF